ncbi:MAG: phosphate ABC transporter permease subunit PstC [Agarilytica sp.]
MDTSVLLVFMATLLGAVYVLGRGRSLSLAESAGGKSKLNSLPFYYGMLTALWSGIPALFILGLWTIFQSEFIEYFLVQQMPVDVRSLDKNELGLVLNKIYNVAYGQYVGDAPPFIIQAAEQVLALEQKSRWLMSVLVLLSMVVIAAIVWVKIHPQLKARLKVEVVFKNALLACACIAILTTVGIVLSVLAESLRFFQSVPLSEFLFGLEWSPQSALRKDQVTGESSFGAVPLFAGTLLIALIAMIVAVPTGLMSAIYLSEYAPKKARSYIKPALEVLAGIPTVVYGFIAALTVAPFIRDFAMMLGLDEFVRVTSESALAAGLMMGVMIIPFVSSLSDDVINAVPQSLRDGALGLGSTQSEVVKRVVIPAALPGIVSSILLAVSRAIGETMIVVMAAGLAAKLTANPLDSVTTVTVQIVTLLVGDQEFDSPKTLAAFALGLMLFIVTLSLNYVSLHVVKKYREQYD